MLDEPTIRVAVVQFIVIAAVMAYFALLVVNWLRKRRLRAKLVTEGRLPEKIPYSRRQILVWVLAVPLVVVSFASGIYPDSELGAWFRWWFTGGWGMARVLGLCLLVGILAGVAHYIRHRDPLLNEIVRQFRSGDREGAVKRLAEEVEREDPTGQRREVLAQLYLTSGCPNEAAEEYLEAWRRHPWRIERVVHYAKAMALGNRQDQALAVVEEARARHPHEAGLACASCILLLAMGKTEEAAEQVRQAEELSQAAKQHQKYWWDYEIEQCRKMIDSLPGRAFPVQPIPEALTTSQTPPSTPSPAPPPSDTGSPPPGR